MPILLIDSYDSFTFNLSTLVEKVTGQKVVTIHNDSLSDQHLIQQILPLFDAVVVGPGPGHPAVPSDVGVLPALWKLTETSLVPVFGVCLGFQSLVLGFGGEISRLKIVKHGQPGFIRHNGSDIFEGLPQGYPSIRYHSLYAAKLPPCLEELAWCSDNNDAERIIMAIKHKQLPFWGVQYHPESICSEQGQEIILNFWQHAQKWSVLNHRLTRHDAAKYDEMLKYSIKPKPLFDDSTIYSSRSINENIGGNINGNASSNLRNLNGIANGITNENTNGNSRNANGTFKDDTHVKGFINFKSTFFDPDIIPLTMISDQLDTPFVILGSGAHPGRWSIIGVLENGVTPLLSYYRTYQSNNVFVRKLGDSVDKSTVVPIGDLHGGIWSYLAGFMAPKIDAYKDIQRPQDATFIGGLVGYFGYDSASTDSRPPYRDCVDRRYADVSLVYVDRTILVDNDTKRAFAVSLRPNDNEWVDFTLNMINSLEGKEIPPVPNSLGEHPTVVLPDKNEYIAHINEAKNYLLSGDSYELCLTAQTKISFPQPIDSYKLYKILYKRNPAPYSCYFNFDSTLVGSSPERFMSWTKDGVCEFRPIKGTVKKGPTVTKEMADKILNSPKERGENLMIVDLIRHDLNQLLTDVRVSKLMTVEEYKTVYQLVSVIKGNLPDNYKGLDLLAHSLPPGSMTGAPKIRSVEILEDLEDNQPRGIYSGVAGYWSVHDEGDWSVIIRSAFSYVEDGLREWRIGAGGAITILSDCEEEWEEMKIKLESALQAFV